MLGKTHCLAILKSEVTPSADPKAEEANLMLDPMAAKRIQIKLRDQGFVPSYIDRWGNSFLDPARRIAGNSLAIDAYWG